jgi:hypothetical protein
MSDYNGPATDVVFRYDGHSRLFSLYRRADRRLRALSRAAARRRQHCARGFARRCQYRELALPRDRPARRRRRIAR